MNSILRRRRAAMAAQGGGYEHGTWEDLFHCIDKGTYATDYALGEILPLDMGNQGVVNAQIVAFNKDTKYGTSKTVPVTFITQKLLATSRKFNSTSPIGWKDCDLRTYCSGTAINLIPENVRSRIVGVKKYTDGMKSDNSGKEANQLTEDYVWVPSCKELFNAGETSGPTYTGYFTGNSLRAKSKVGGSAIEWSTRSISRGSPCNISTVAAGGGRVTYESLTTAFGVAIGFCVE